MRLFVNKLELCADQTCLQDISVNEFNGLFAPYLVV